MPGADATKAGLDGRTARAQRTREAVVDAVLSIIEDGDVRPTAPRIAARAGVSLRSIYQHFSDLENLLEAVAQRQSSRLAERVRPVPAELPLDERVAHFLAQRTQVLEFMSPLQRALYRYEGSSPSAQATRDRMLALARREIAVLFGRELLTSRRVRHDVLDALDAAASWPVWDNLRHRLVADERAAVAVLERLLLALIRHGPLVAPAGSGPAPPARRAGRRPPAAPNGDPGLDGRVARGERSRSTVVRTVLDLIAEGDLRPTAQRVAERAGVSLRSVFHHFEDMEALYAAAADLHARRVVPPVGDLPSGGPRDQRVDAFVALRCRVLESSTPLRRAARLVEPESPAVLGRLRAAVAFWRVAMLEAFAPEVTADPALADPLTVVTGWEFWDALRNQQHVSAARAERVVHRAVSALLHEESP